MSGPVIYRVDPYRWTPIPGTGLDVYSYADAVLRLPVTDEGIYIPPSIGTVIVRRSLS